MIEKKRIVITEETFDIYGDSTDTYYTKYIHEGDTFYDVPILLAEKYCPEDAVILDVGANIGAVACALSVIAPKGKTYAIEASPMIHKLLEKNLEANNIKNVEPINVAASDHNGTVFFQEDPSYLAGSRVVAEGDGTVRGVNVAAVRIDDLMKDRKIDRLDFIKMDVEGHEQEALEGMRQTLSKFKPFCVLEFNAFVMIYHNRQFPQDFMDYLKSIFPRIYAFDRMTLGLTEITENTDQFVINNLLTGCVDDLVCGFDDLPAASPRFERLEAGRRANEAAVEAAKAPGYKTLYRKTKKLLRKR
jgi:FkbM family methyltransferase